MGNEDRQQGASYAACMEVAGAESAGMGIGAREFGSPENGNTQNSDSEEQC